MISFLWKQDGSFMGVTAETASFSSHVPGISATSRLRSGVAGRFPSGKVADQQGTAHPSLGTGLP